MGFTQPADLALPGGDTKIMLCRQAAYPAWATQTRTTPEMWVTTFSAADPQTANPVASRDVQILPNPFAYLVGNRATANLTLPSITGNTVVAPYPIIGVDSALGSQPFVYVPEGYVAAFLVTFGLTNTNSGNISIEYEYWDAPGQVVNAKVAANVTAANQGGLSTTVAWSSGGNWVRPVNLDYSFTGAFPAGSMSTNVSVLVTNGTVTYTASGSNAGNLAVAASGGTANSFLPLVYPAEIANSTLPWNSTRLTSVGGLFTNVTQVLLKGGTILAGRVSPATWNPFITSKTVISNLHPSEKAFLPLETGLYTYCPPSTDLADFYDYTAVTTNAVVVPGPAVPIYRLDNTSLVNMAFINPGANPGALAVNISWHIEFRTTSALFQIGMSPLTLESLHQAQLALSQVGFFFDNPDHTMIITSVLKALKMYLPAAAAAVSAGLGMIQRKKKKGGRKKRPRGNRPVVPKRNPQVVPATTIKSSGAMRPKMRGGLDIYLFRKR